MRITSAAALANAVRNQRKLVQKTQRETADLVGIKQTTVSDFELKPESTKLDTLFKILAALDLELHVSKRGAELTDGNNKKREW
ncbi:MULTISPECIES: helix-turn-helix domain-containing protein [Rheinheimera]|jgi:HTH-type transcriptional regulator/antitoxin HipB|uniref:Helix-turn-helix domain-containing protein n=1 Tax=Rheinheimera tilapiae TaxID=875043 RepID=A0ABV6B8K6_9GAMM